MWYSFKDLDFYIISIGSLDLPKRPGYGTTGRKTRVATNFFEIDFKDYDIYHYDVSISPSTCPRALNRQVLERLVLMYQKIFGGHKPVYDGQKNVYTVQPLPIGKDKVLLGNFVNGYGYSIQPPLSLCQGRIQPEVKGGQFREGAPKRRFFGLRSIKLSGFPSE